MSQPDATQEKSRGIGEEKAGTDAVDPAILNEEKPTSAAEEPGSEYGFD